MARARNIKPGFFKNEHLVELPFETRLLFIGLWTLADREGRLEDRPKRIQIELFPCDSVDVEKSLQQLADEGFIQRYQVDGAHYVQIINFLKHQKPHNNEKASEIPPPSPDGEQDFLPRCEVGTTMEKSTRAESLFSESLTTDSQSTETTNTPTAVPASGDSEYPSDFEEFWSTYPAVRRQEKLAAFRQWKARLKKGAKPAQLIQAAKNYAAATVDKDPQYIKMPKTFLGANKPYEDYLRSRGDPAKEYTHVHPVTDLQDAIRRKTRLGGEAP